MRPAVLARHLLQQVKRLHVGSGRDERQLAHPRVVAQDRPAFIIVIAKGLLETLRDTGGRCSDLQEWATIAG
jgi:hypothetical protein